MAPLPAIFTSPLVRTVQTAQTLSIAQHYEGPVRVHRSLLPMMPVGALETLLSEHAGQNVAVIGHQPSMGAVATTFWALASFPKPVNPSTVIGVERDDDEGAGAARRSTRLPARAFSIFAFVAEVMYQIAGVKLQLR